MNPERSNIVPLPLPTQKQFVPPTFEEALLQGAKIGLPELQVELFWNYYDSKVWKVGKTPMKVWRSALTGWKLRWQERQATEKVRQETPSANVNIIRWQNELERVEKKIESIRASYAAFQTWEQGDRNLVNCLKKRRTELLEKLNMVV